MDHRDQRVIQVNRVLQDLLANGDRRDLKVHEVFQELLGHLGLMVKLAYLGLLGREGRRYLIIKYNIYFIFIRITIMYIF